MSFNDMIERAESDSVLAKAILGLIAGYCRQGEQLPKDFAVYLADCLEEAITDPINAQSALNLKKTSPQRGPDEFRNPLIYSFFGDFMKEDPSMPLERVAQRVQDELKLPITTRQIKNIYQKLSPEFPKK